MPDAEPGLLQAVLDNPDDDAVRLVYADFLEEQGGERVSRAEFIRVQVVLARGEPDRPDRPVRTARFSQVNVSDAELRLLAHLPELEEIEGRSVTNQGLLYLTDLRRLKSLQIDMTQIDSLSAITDLPALERLAFGSDDVPFTDAGTEGLEHLMSLSGGNGEGFRHLAGLHELRYLYLGGDAVTDSGIRHLNGLKKLRTVMAQSSAISPAGARALAEQLPGVTIILGECVVKSPRSSIPCRRRLVSGFASALFPANWTDDERSQSSYLWVREDGWERVGCWSGGVVGPVEVRLSVRESAAPPVDYLLERVEGGPPNPQLLEDSPVEVEMPEGAVGASCVYRDRFGQHLLWAGVLGKSTAFLDCEAPPSRFEEFRPLFLFVAPSVRLGEAAAEEESQKFVPHTQVPNSAESV